MADFLSPPLGLFLAIFAVKGLAWRHQVRQSSTLSISMRLCWDDHSKSLTPVAKGLMPVCEWE
jgi:hypothetical protein